MASDEDYMSFLNKANENSSNGQVAAQSSTSGGQQFKATDAGSQAPKGIRDACKDAVYVSDADEPFVEVSLNWSGKSGLPDEVEFANLIQHWDADNADISILDPLDWDSRGQYSHIIDAVRKATAGNDVRVYKVVRDHSRVEYWVISREDKEERIVGVKALAIES